MEKPNQLARLINGYRSTALLYLAAKLNLADLLAAGPAEARELADRIKMNEDALERLLRGLAAIEIVIEEADGRFSLSALGAGLRSQAPGSFREEAILAGEEYLPAWNAILHSATTGQPAFASVFGMSAWEHRSQNPALQAAFNVSLGEQTATIAQSLLQAYDFSRAKEVIDIGGGQGSLLFALLGKHPALRGVLFESPLVAASFQIPAAPPGLAARLRAVAGDFFVSIPTGADLYLLKSILHDWDDAQCRRILHNCRQAMAPGSRLLIIERFLPERAIDDVDTIFLDLHMLIILGGRERRENDYQRLANEAGFRFGQTFPASSGFCMMEFLLATGENS